ncbi:glycosyltransferase [Opitutus terrae]|uniref:Glycosyl transferase family 2 n=1 Tax=Opitutus terrae (strain DSM 11246 / JCM 15787 / PB90-1) TaxID=452637 RepID=B1ZW34_OPITP|nr:glycosyltransferase [Opitutus terrae]ACB76048.1 glycosyl transferase family 2 [Opitutus terrae PB90-1]
MQQRPLVSIVLPVHNGERYLRESVRSCLDQTYQNWELIAVDDCSTDGTAAMLDSFAAREPRMRVLRNPANLRLPASLNVGFAASRGEILTWTSDDNLYLPNALEEMVSALMEHREAMMVYAAQDIIDESGAVVVRYPSGSPESLCHFNVVNACFAYRRKVLETVGGYDPILELVEDWDYWLRIARRYEIIQLECCLYLYRANPASLSQQTGDRRWKVEERLLEMRLPELRWKWPAGYARGFIRLCHPRWQRGDRRTAWRHFGRALRYFPVALRHWRALIPLCLGKRVYYALRARLRWLEQRPL